jgi:class 3 adenylate cyclase
MISPHFGVLREVVAKRKDGSEFPCILGIKKLSGKNSTLTVGFLRDITKEKEAMELAIQKRAAEELLMNVLPEEVATRLKQDPSHIADHFTTATILFADIVGFTQMSAHLEAAHVVALLNDLFSRFDKRLEVYGLNKIKTIGDCYMICSVPNNNDPLLMCKAVCHFALDMLQVLDQYNEDNNLERPLNVRVGIDCGPVVAGVIGTKRFLYDVWGHPVNVASRMESTGEPGQIQVTKHIVDSVPSDEFLFTSRGTIQVKGIGDMTTFFLTDRLKTRSEKYWSLLEPAKISEIQKLSKSTRRVSETPSSLKDTCNLCRQEA